MRPRHRVTRAAIDLIKRFEGYRRQAAQLPDGRWTIGYGHTLTARQGAEVSEEDAEALLLYDLIGVAHAVNEHTFATLTPNQFDALCAFAFNIGLDNFRQSAVLKRINEGQPIQAAFAMELWRKAHFQGERIVVDALVRRRAAEKLLFLTPPGEAWTPVPSPVLRPVLDLDGLDATPRQTPAPIAASFEAEEIRLTREDEAPPVAVAAEPPPSPVATAAEEVAARLQSIYPDTGEPAAAEPEARPAPDIPAESHPQADFAPPITVVEEAAPEPPISETPAAEIEPASPLEDFGPDEPSPFGRAEPANDPQDGETETAEPASGRKVIDDLSRFDFTPATVQPLPDAPRDGALTLVALAILGLAFFGGGIFWAMNARDTRVGMLTPLSVGLMAGLAGIGFFCVAVFLLLQRLARAAERRSKSSRR